MLAKEILGGEKAYLEGGTGGTVTTVGDLDLQAADLVLGLVDVGAVNTNVLKNHLVLSLGSVRGDTAGNVVPVVVAPGGRGEVTTIADTLLVDLEPVTANSTVGLDAAGGLGHVDEAGARVLEFGTDGQLGADLVTSLDGQDLRLAGRGEGALVANDIGAIGRGSVTDVGSRVGGELDGVVLGGAGRLADVFEGGLLGAANDVGIEKVVGSGHLGDGGDEESRELHCDRAATSNKYGDGTKNRQ